MAFPVSLASSLSISGTQPLSTYSHGTGVHVEDRNDIIALGRKLGLGTANAVASGTTALLGTGGTQSAWGQITNAYIAGTAAIAVSKLAALTSGLVRSNGTVISGGATITNADVDAAGAISLSKLAATTSGLVRSDGTVIAGGATVSSSDIVNDTIVNANINSAAAIALSKLAAGGSNGDVVTQVAGVLALAAPSSSFTLLSSQTLAAPAASVTFSSISGAYKHLLLLSNTRTTVGSPSFASMAYNFNGDTGAHYANQLLAGAQATGQTSLAIGGVVGSTSYANMFILNRLWIHDYAQASYVKVCDSVVFGFSGSGPTTGNMYIYGGLWYATPAAITTILLMPASGSFAIGSKFWLYGVN